MTLKKPQILEALINALASIPGIGPKTAQRMVIFLLYHNKQVGKKLSDSLEVALRKIQNCSMCNSLTDSVTCSLCLDSDRDQSKLCVVENPADLMILEQTNVFKGKYFVLMGKISPIEGIGPEELNFQGLIERITKNEIREIIIATNFTTEGEATANAIELILRNKKLVPPRVISRLARGVPFGAEIEYTDLGTIAQAVRERKIGDN